MIQWHKILIGQIGNTNSRINGLSALIFEGLNFRVTKISRDLRAISIKDCKNSSNFMHTKYEGKGCPENHGKA